MDRNCVLTITTTVLCLPLVISLCNDPNCAVCTSGGNNCYECKKGFTVTANNCFPCPTNCVTCTANSFCLSCSPGFWGSPCIYTCPDNCNETGCEKISGYCLKCKPGWYGPQCQQDCNRCENEQCELRHCSTGCKDGYLKDIYNDVSDCHPCPSFCKNCSSSLFCTECYTGHYIYQYTVEAKQVSTCLNCSSIVPRCTYDKNYVSCKSCEIGYVVNLNQCDKTAICIHCQNGCDSKGRCLGGCKPGWTGQTCDYTCSDVCETCINQDACLSCKDGFYTQTCNVPCNKNCQSGNYPMCRFGVGLVMVFVLMDVTKAFRAINVSTTVLTTVLT